MATERTAKKKEAFLKLLPQHAGMVSPCCKAVGISRNTFYEWIKKDSKFKKQYEEVVESLIDFAEGMLMKQIQDGNIAAIIFYLKTKGKERGYIERSDIQHSGKVDSSITVEVVRVEKKDE